jgi:hypothetical protein
MPPPLREPRRATPETAVERLIILRDQLSQPRSFTPVWRGDLA